MNMQAIDLLLLFGINNQSIPPFFGDWRLWNGSADVPFVSLGAQYQQYTESAMVSAVPIDGDRFLLISQGYSADSYVPATVQAAVAATGDLLGSPVNLDADSITQIGQNFSYIGLNVVDGKICLFYGWENGNTAQNIAYVVVINVDDDNNITFGTKAQVGPSDPSDAAEVLVFSNTGNSDLFYAIYLDNGSGAIVALTCTLNDDDTITVNSPEPLPSGSVIGTWFNDSVLAIFSGVTLYAYPLSGTTIGNAITGIQIFVNEYGNTRAICQLAQNKILITYDQLDTVSEVGLISAVIATFNPTSMTISLGKPMTLYTMSEGGNYAECYEALPTGNSANQVIATILIADNNQNFSNIFATCLTPSNNDILQSDLVPINANALFDNVDAPPVQSAVINELRIVSPYTSYDLVNFGVTVLSPINNYPIPYEFYHFEADTGVTAELQTSLGDAVGTINSNVFSILSSTDYSEVLLPGASVTLNGTDVYTVVSATFATNSTIVVTAEQLTSVYTSVACQLNSVTSWASGTLQLDNAGGVQIPVLGKLNNRSTIVFYSANDDAYLFNALFNMPMTVNATYFLVCKTLGTGYYLTSIKAANVSPLADISSTNVGIYPDVNVGDYDLTPSLTLISLVRQDGNTSVYLNGVLNATDSTLADILAIGDPISIYVGNNAGLSGALKGYISAYSCWLGALTVGQRQAQESYFIEKYITGVGINFSLLDDQNFELLSGTEFTLVG